MFSSNYTLQGHLQKIHYEKPKEKEMTEAEREALELADVPTIPDSEISPAAYIFQNQEDRDDL